MLTAELSCKTWAGYAPAVFDHAQESEAKTQTVRNHNDTYAQPETKMESYLILAGFDDVSFS